MWKILFWTSSALLMNIVLKCGALPKPCEEKEKSLALLEMAKDSILKAKDNIPECDDKSNMTHKNQSLCGKKEKSSAYLDVALELIENTKKNFPSCDFEIVTEPEEEKPEVKTLPSDCVDVQKRGQRHSGIYTVRLFNESANINKTVSVYCDMDTDGGGWTVLQRRAMYSVQENFDRGWMDYKYGFGNLSQEFWIGNDVISALTNTGSNTLRFDMRDVKGDTAYAVYKYFNVANETDGYRLTIGNYSGNAGDAGLNNRRFSTKDRLNDGDKSCPDERKGGWWYENCAHCNPNGLYRPGENGDHTIFWQFWKKREGLSFIEIKTRNSYLSQQNIIKL